MSILKKPKSVQGPIQQALGAVGGEPLDGSGFEDETPDEGFGEDKDNAPGISGWLSASGRKD